MNLLSSEEECRTIHALARFVRELVNDCEYDFVVPVERKGTALVRAAMGDAPLVKWRQVLSTNALEYFASDDASPHVLLLDDCVWTGRSMISAIQKVRQYIPKARITTAALVTHSSAPRGLVNLSYYPGLDTSAYEQCRAAIIQHLQESGSLLLDTEHVEVLARIDADPETFFSYVAGWGNAVQFASPGRRLNCTVTRRLDEERKIIEKAKVRFAEPEGVCKIRIVSRPGQRNTYSLIPICYPTLRLSGHQTYSHPEMNWTKLVTWNADKPNSRFFQCVGLCLSIELLIDFINWLQDGLPDRIEFNYAFDGVDHLRAVFPEIDVSEVRGQLDRIHRARRPRNVRASQPDDPGLKILEDLAQVILDQCYDRWEYQDGFVKALPMSEILRISRLTGHSETRVSAALDILIDSARMLPQVSYVVDSGIISAKRIFSPEGEIVRRKVVRRAQSLGKGLELASGY